MLLAIFALVLLVGDPAAPSDTITKTGRVLFLSEALKAKGITADPEPIAKQVALVEPDGTLTSIVPEEPSRALFADERLRGRKVEMIVRKTPGLSLLRVVLFRVEEDGVLRVPEYYCDVCSIAVRFPQTCPCCQGPMDLRMRPENR